MSRIVKVVIVKHGKSLDTNLFDFSHGAHRILIETDDELYTLQFTKANDGSDELVITTYNGKLSVKPKAANRIHITSVPF